MALLNGRNTPDQTCGPECRYRELYEGTQGSLSEMAASQARSLSRVGRFRDGIRQALRTSMPRSFNELEAAVGHRISDADDELLLSYLTYMLDIAVSGGVDQDNWPGREALRVSLGELGIDTASNDPVDWAAAVERWAAAQRSNAAAARVTEPERQPRTGRSLTSVAVEREQRRVRTFAQVAAERGEGVGYQPAAAPKWNAIGPGTPATSGQTSTPAVPPSVDDNNEQVAAPPERPEDILDPFDEPAEEMGDPFDEPAEEMDDTSWMDLPDEFDSGDGGDPFDDWGPPPSDDLIEADDGGTGDGDTVAPQNSAFIPFPGETTGNETSPELEPATSTAASNPAQTPAVAEPVERDTPTPEVADAAVSETKHGTAGVEETQPDGPGELEPLTQTATAGDVRNTTDEPPPSHPTPAVTDTAGTLPAVTATTPPALAGGSGAATPATAAATSPQVVKAVFRPDLFGGGTTKAPPSRRRRQPRVRATPPDAALDVPADLAAGELDSTVRNQIDASVTIPRPVFTSDLVETFGHEAVEAWMDEHLRDGSVIKFLSPKARHRDRGSLVLPVAAARTASVEFDTSWWAECLRTFAGARLYEVAVVMHAYGDSILTSEIWEHGHTIQLRLTQPRGVVGVCVVVQGDLTAGGLTREAMLADIEALMKTRVELIVVAATLAPAYDDIVDVIGTESALRKWVPPCPIVVGRSWEWASGNQTALAHICG